MATTPQQPQRRVPAAPDTTRPAALTSTPARTPTHAVQGPATWENGRDPATAPGPLVVHGPPATAALPRTVGVNPDAPANRSRSAPADSVPLSYPGESLITPYNGLTC